MGAVLRDLYTTRDLLSRAEEYRQRAGTARTADIQGALLTLAKLYEEAADQRQRTTQSELEPA
jgi:hypothetical protein